MPTPAWCPECDAHLNVPNRAAGTSVACPDCRVKVFVPRFVAPRFVAPRAAVRTGNADGGREKQPAVPTELVLGVTSAVSFLIFAVCVALALWPRPRDPAADAAKPAEVAAQPAPRNPAPAVAPAPAAVEPAADLFPPAPLTSPPAPTPAPVPAAAPGEWAGGVRLAVSHDSQPTLGPTGCPVALSGGRVWDLAQDKSTGELDGFKDARGLRALSRDGKHFACADKSPNQTDTTVDVWSTETGKKVFSVPGTPDAYADLIAFAGTDRLLLGGRHSPQIGVWDVKGQKRSGTLTTAARRVENQSIAVSADGRYVASAGHDHVEVQKLDDGKVAATLVPKGSKSTDGVFVMAWLKHLSFSPDGSEVAMTSTHPTPHLTVWNSRGKLVLHAALPDSVPLGGEAALDWLPDRPGWLIGTTLIDRATGRVLVRVTVPFASHQAPRLIDGQRLAVEGNGHMNLVPIPWDSLRASLAHLQAGGPAPLTPAAPVSLKVDVTGARGDVAETQKVLTEAVTKRLARDGIRVADGGSTVVRVRLAEQAGEVLPVVERKSPFDRGGTPTGRTATEAKGSLVVEIFAPGEAAPVWRGTVSAGSARSFREEVTDASVRKSMLDDVARRIAELGMPYYIPADKTVAVLPAALD